MPTNPPRTKLSGAEYKLFLAEHGVWVEGAFYDDMLLFVNGILQEDHERALARLRGSDLVSIEGGSYFKSGKAAEQSYEQVLQEWLRQHRAAAEEPFGTLGRIEGGFASITFQDSSEATSEIACSSIVGNYADSLERPGTSALWLGLVSANPQILAREALKLGLPTQETAGWVPYQIPREVLLSTRMHLNREQVRGLITRLQEWLDSGTFKGVEQNG